jgi:hypothetical protein
VPIHIGLVRSILGLPASAIAAPLIVPALATLTMAAGLGPLRLALDGQEWSPWLELALLIPTGIALYGTMIWLTSRELTNLALRTARVIAVPQGKAP